MSHTPAPWFVMKDPQFGVGVMGTRGTQGEPVAQVYSPFADVERDNANLIAAAPDLLMACKALLEELGAIANQEDVSVELWDQAQAAVAKAEGRKL